MLRRFFSRPRTSAVRHAFRPSLEGLEARWVPATFTYNSVKQRLTVTVAPSDTNVDFEAAFNPLGHIRATATAGSFNTASPTRFVRDIVVKVPANASASIDFFGVTIAGSIKIITAATAGTSVNLSNVQTVKGLSFNSSATALTAVDSLAISNSSIGGSVTASLNQGSNVVSLTNSRLGADLAITNAAGADTIDFVQSVHVAGNATLRLGDGANDVNFASGITAVGGSLVCTGGSGGDGIGVTNLADLHVNRNITLNLAGGANGVVFTPDNLVFVGRNLTVRGGDDTDTVEMSLFHVGRHATFSLGNSVADQTVNISSGTIAGNLVINGGSNVDQVFLDTQVRGTSTIALLAGNDRLHVESSDFLGAARFDGGADHDEFLLEVVDPSTTRFGGKLTILGGSGDDELTMGELGSPNTRLIIDGAKTVWNGGLGADIFDDNLVSHDDNGTAPTINWS